MMQKLTSKSIHWLTFAKIVNGEIPLKADHLRDILNRPVPPYSYRNLCKGFTQHLLLNSQDTSFINAFTLGPEKRSLSKIRRIELREMYNNLVNDPERNVIGDTSSPHRYYSPDNKFHVPIQFDALFELPEVSRALVKYLFPTSKQSLASPEEIDVLLATSACVIPSQIRKQQGNSEYLWPEHADDHDYKFWALRFLAMRGNAEFYTVKEEKIEPLFEKVTHIAKRLDKLLELITISNKAIDEKFKSELFDE